MSTIGFPPLEHPALRLAEEWQRGFPLCREPFDRIAAAHGLEPDEVIAMLDELACEGSLARIGAAVRPNVVGASTLAALAAPAECLEKAAAFVSAEPGVNHNYERTHPYNLWFVVTAPHRSGVAATLDRIRRATGCDVIDLPLERSYHIDLGFRLSGPRNKRAASLRPPVAGDVDERDRALIDALRGGLDLVARPYARLAAQVGCTEDEAIVRLDRLVSSGVISRLGCILRHRNLGFTANAMAVWDVPDSEVDRLGERLAAHEAVTLCYRRRRARPQWPYNLFAMVHGREPAAVECEIAAAAGGAGLSSYRGAILFSRRCFKQEAARYGSAAEAAA